METNNESIPVRRKAWYEVRFPLLYLLIGVMFTASATVGVIVDGRGVPATAVGFLSGAFFTLIASLTLLRRARTGRPAMEQGPLAQESDPNRR